MIAGQTPGGMSLVAGVDDEQEDLEAGMCVPCGADDGAADMSVDHT
jgi:hypothetical protein